MAGKILHIIISVLLVCSGLLPDPLQAQPVQQVRIGEPFPLKGTFIYPKLFYGNDAYYLLSFRSPDFLLCKEGVPEFTVETFDSSLNHTVSMPARGSLGVGHRLEPLFLDWTGKSFCIFATETSVAAGTSRCIAFRMDPDGEMQVGPVNLGELSGMGKSAKLLYSAREDAYFRVTKFQDDAATFYLYTQQFPVQGQSTAKLMVKVLDTALSVQRSKLLNLTVYPEYCQFSDIVPARGGLFFILTIQLPFEDKVFKLVTYSFDRDELSYYDFKMEGKKIHSLETTLLSQGNILIRGLYAENDSREEVDGLLYFLFDNDNQTLLSSGSVGIPGGEQETADLGLNNLRIRDTYVRPNGDVVILTELYWTEVIDFTDSDGKLYLRPYYHSDDLLCLSFDRTGAFKWHAWIPREFGSSSEDMLGFHSLQSDSVAYIIYNDHPENLTIYAPESIRRVKNKYVPMMCLLDLETGSFHKYTISEPSDHKAGFTFRKDYVSNLSSRSMIWIMTDGNVNLMRITFGNEGMSSKGKN